MLKKGFLKGYANVLNLILRLLDMTVVLVCGVLAYYYSAAYEVYLAAGVDGLPPSYLKVILFAVFLTAVLFPLFTIYRVWRGSSTLTEIRYLTLAWVLVGLLLTGFAFVTKSGADYSRSWMGLWFFSTWLSLIGLRGILRTVLSWLRSNGFNHRHIVIVGTGEQAEVVADRLQRSTWFGLEISALFGVDHPTLPSGLKGKKLLSDYQELRRYIDDGDVDQVWISLPHSEEDVIRKVIAVLEGSTVEIRYVPDIFLNTS